MSDKQKDLIREVFMRNGFTIKDGRDDLADYVYAAAHELLQVAPAVQGEPVAEVRIENDYWNRGHFYEGYRKELKAVSSIQGLPVGTKLYTTPQPAPETQMEVVGWQFHQDGKWRNGDDRIKDHKKNTQEAGFRVRDVYAAPQPAEQRNAPDTALVEAFDAGRRAAQAETRRLRDWIKETSRQFDICTYNVLKEICDGCRCKRYGKAESIEVE